MTRYIITALIVVLVSGPVWAGSSEIQDCETLIKSILKFPGSYQREHIVYADPVKTSVEGKDGKEGKWIKIDTWWRVKIEFTGRNEHNVVKRRIGKCDLSYDKGGFFSSKTLNRKNSTAEIQYD